MSGWESNKDYKKGDFVTYQEKLYAASKAHTSESDQFPPEAPELWSEVHLAQQVSHQQMFYGKHMAMDAQKRAKELGLK